ncbi:MAG: hypothetical protein WHS77_03985 [Brevinematales bacterium]
MKHTEIKINKYFNKIVSKTLSLKNISIILKMKIQPKGAVIKNIISSTGRLKILNFITCFSLNSHTSLVVKKESQIIKKIPTTKKLIKNATMSLKKNLKKTIADKKGKKKIKKFIHI